jgi:hypothetical protein
MTPDELLKCDEKFRDWLRDRLPNDPHFIFPTRERAIEDTVDAVHEIYSPEYARRLEAVRELCQAQRFRPEAYAKGRCDLASEILRILEGE